MAKTASKVAAQAEAPTEKELDQFLAPMKRDIDEALAELREMRIVTPADYKIAGEMLKELAHRQTVLDDKRKSWVEPLKAVSNDIDATFRPVIKGLKDGVEMLKEKLGEAKIAMEAKREELLKLSVAATGKKAEALQVEAEAFIPPEIPGVHTTIGWTGEVSDADKLPREYMVPNVTMLEELTAALGRDPKIPGWTAKKTSSTTTTRKGR